MRIHLSLVATTIVTVIAVFCVVNLASALRPVHAAGGGLCSNLVFQGGYGFAGSGFTRAAQQPIAFEGGFIAIANTTPGATDGTLTGGTETVNRAGNVTRTTFTGTYQMVSSRCGGTVGILTNTGTIFHYDFDLNQWSSGSAQEINFIETDQRDVVVLTVRHV